jgi:Spy/CpxP family protein refolding chaperone
VKNPLALAVVTGALLVGAAVAAAQTAPAQPAAPQVNGGQHVLSSQELEMLRKDIRSQKKQLMAQNLRLSDAQATKFWPVYDQYTAELVKINNKKYATIQQFADQFGTLSDDQAMSLIQQWLTVDSQVAQLRMKYLPIVAQAIGGKQAATWAQLDRRLQMMIDLQLGARVPLVQSQ